MFDKEFYPTPKNIIELMVNRIGISHNTDSVFYHDLVFCQIIGIFEQQSKKTK